MKSSLQPSSLPTYRRAWELYTLFLSATFHYATVTLPVSPSMLALFIAFLFEKNYAPSTVNTYISAIGYSHKFYNFHNPSKVFFIVQMLKGYNKIGFRLDNRLPVTLPILHKLLHSIPSVVDSDYNVALFKAMFSLAFFAFLRIGEITTDSSPKHNITLQLDQLAFSVDSSNVDIALKLTFRDYKHSYNQPRFTLNIEKQNVFCPVTLIRQYLNLRGYNPGPIFISLSRQPISRDFFCQLLNRTLTYCNLDPSRYKGHSFRIGAATHAAEQGLADAQIRSLGRWKSNAFLKYIRVSSFSSR